MGSVYLAWDSQRKEAVAVKRVLEPRASSLLRFKREFRAVERLRHPNLVRLFELGTDASGLFIAMEVLDGVSLLRYFGRTPSSRSQGSSGWDRGGDSSAETVLDSGPASSSASEPGPPTRSPGPAGSVVLVGDRVRVEPDELLARLAHVLPQLIEALAFLHGHKIVHRDLKPANVMVTHEGVVKLLDFGILAQLGRQGREAGGESELVGTPGYIAPEQIQGEPPRPANDLYALGVILYEILAGRPVFEGAPMALLMQHVEIEPPSVGEAAPWAPAPLVQACDGLLRRDPGMRPSLLELSESLLPALGGRRAVFPVLRPALPAIVGRLALQGALRARVQEARTGRFALIALTGPTGAGKSALAEWLGDEMAGMGLTVLRGRGRQSERVPFNALDGVIDELAVQLGQLHHRRGDRDFVSAMGTAATSFPVLRPRRAGATPAENEITRRAAFAAVTELLAACAERRGGVLALIDDLQWADADSVALLEHIVTSAPPAVTVVATLRDDVGANVASSWLAGCNAAERLDVDPLDQEALEQIVRRAALVSGVEPSATAVREAAADCQGRPIFAELAGRSMAREPGRARRSLNTSIRGVLEERSDTAEEILALVMAADEWTDVGVLLEAIDRSPGEIEDELFDLEQAALLRRAGPAGSEGRVDVYHDAVRTALLAVIGGEGLERAHGRLADLLLRRSDTAPERLVRHLLGAGRAKDAARRARTAAARAEEQRAFGLAADMYEVALRHAGADRLALLKARANALGLATRYLEAAAAWRELSGLLQGREAADAALREAHALLSANDITGGHERLNAALVAAGEPPLGRTGVSRLVSGVGFLVGPMPLLRRYRGPGTEPDPVAGADAERDIRIGMLVGHFDPLTGLRLLQRAQTAFDRAGVWEQAAFCDYLFSFFALFGTPRAGPVPLATRYERSARRRLAGREPRSTTIRLMPQFLEGVRTFRSGDWGAASRTFEALERRFAEAGLVGSYEYMRVIYHVTMLAYAREDLDELAAWLARWRAAAVDGAKLATRSNLAIFEHLYLVRCGQFEEARGRIRALAAEYPPDHLNLQRHAIQFVGNLPDVFLTDCREARRRILALSPARRSFRGLTDMYAATYAGVAALVEANALRSGDHGASRFLVSLFASIARRAPPMHHSWAVRAEAYAADAAGDPETALVRLREAEASAQAVGSRADASVAQFQLGLRLQGDEGAALRSGARATLAELGVSERLLHEDFGYR